MPPLLPALLRSLRPTHWSKNAFVLAPLLFARRFGDPGSVRQAFLLLGLWCALASAVYLFNDVRDRENDRLHPAKKLRPIAAGALPVGIALSTAAGLGAGSLGAALFFLPAATAAAVGAGLFAYLLLNLAYSLHLKTIPYLDVSLVATGFVLRVFTGARAIEVPASPYLLLCSAGLALFLALCKRRAEATRTRATASAARPSVMRYDLRRLDLLCKAFAGLTTLAYLAYSIAPATVANVGDLRMLVTVPFVGTGLLRYLHLVLQKGEGEDPTRLARRDPVLLGVTLSWILACVLALSL